MNENKPLALPLLYKEKRMMTDKDLCENCAFKNKCEKYRKCLILQEKLDIAVKALEFYEKPFCRFHFEYNIAQHHKRAEEALAKIKEFK